MNLFADAALLPEGWARDVRITLDPAHGTIAAVECDAGSDGAERLSGPVVPAMPNVHSHAFQRAVAGRTGVAAPSAEESFWTWRRAMYAFLERVDADAFQAIAAQAYVEMVKAGYSSVAEFHYVHHDQRGKPFADPAEMAHRVVAAAESAGIALTLLPVFYAHGGFGKLPASAGQQRFVHATHTFARLYERLRADSATRGYSLGVAPHSLRAVAPDELTEVVALAGPGAAVHMHVAEQTQEVNDCVAWSGRRPVEWVLENARPDARWCLIHATHMTERETQALARSGAVAGLAPTTECDLGDGTFPGSAYVGWDGKWGVGSDSNTAIDPFAELRQFEYTQRLRFRRRNVLMRPNGVSLGTQLWAAAARGGAQACARPAGAIAAGARADLVVLDDHDPSLVGHPAQSILDAAIFGPARRPVRGTMIGGTWVVREGRHAREEAILATYRDAIASVYG